MTVSRVVRGRPDVSQASRRKVLAAVRRLGYLPNPAARSLVTRTPTASQERIIGTLFSRDVLTSHSYFAGIIQGIADEARQLDVHLLFGSGLEDSQPPPAIPRMIREAMTRRLILVGKAPPRFVRQLRANGFSLVLVDMRPPLREADAIVCDDALGAYDAIRHLIKLGHRKIAIIPGPARHPFSQALTAGYRRALRESDIPWRDSLVLAAPFGPAAGYEAAELLLKGDLRPTAIFTNDDRAIGVLRALRDRRLSVPGEMAVVGYDDIEYAAHITPPLTTVAVPKEEMGRLAVRKALAQLTEGERHVYSTTVVSHTLVVRASCGVGGPVAPRNAAGRRSRS
ncbi:MAG: LacI family DNA-binding transcriptional regulator [candidate division NC10 bacterium]|nr:LacI family DNA-binding transcriptional regulator [candidate division NC10 bacterium]